MPMYALVPPSPRVRAAHGGQPAMALAMAARLIGMHDRLDGAAVSGQAGS